MMLLDRAHAAGLRVTREGDELVVRGPTRLAPLAREILGNKAQVMAFLEAGDCTPEPASSCAMCSTIAWVWQPEWPSRGTGRWLCGTFGRRPVPSLAELAAELTAEERTRLRREVAARDRLAIQVVGALMLVTCVGCGGDRWRYNLSSDGERCTTCDVGSPCSLLLEGRMGVGREPHPPPRDDVTTSPARKPAQPTKEEDDESEKTDHGPAEQGLHGVTARPWVSPRPRVKEHRTNRAVNRRHASGVHNHPEGS
jgi:hypothetical protein